MSELKLDIITVGYGESRLTKQKMYASYPVTCAKSDLHRAAAWGGGGEDSVT